MKNRYAVLKKDIRSLIRRAVDEAKRKGKEICGLIVDSGFCLEFVICKNKSVRPGSFSFYFGEVRSIVEAAKRLGHEVVGTFHSHPLGLDEPGDTDITNAVNDSLILIISCSDRRVALWRIKSGKASKITLLQIDQRELNEAITWYAAHVIVSIRPVEPDNREICVYENVILVSARSYDAARVKALKYAKASIVEDETLRINEKPAEMSFVGIRKIIEVSNPWPLSQSEDRPRDGTEITYSEFTLRGERALFELAKGDEVHVRYLE
jgi:proteasome lid subunit RPN8/RPN11